MSKKIARLGALALAGCALHFPLYAAAQAASGAKPASSATAAANRAFAATLPLADRQDYEDAQRGFIAALPGDADKQAFIKGAVPDSVNPSLWRLQQLNAVTGLFKVGDGIYQLRGQDISNMTLIEGNSGWIVIDPLVTSEMARAALELAMQHLGRKPVVAVIYTHGHADHFGGVRGVVSEADVAAGKVRIIAPQGFMESAVAENVLAGNAMTRRAQYQFGTALEDGAQGRIGTGLGNALSIGTIGLIPPTEAVDHTGQELNIDGLRFVFQMANGSEAPAEMMFYLPEKKALCLAEVATATMHNIYTLRGARARDALGWSKYINQLLDQFPDAEVGFRSHHWPVWGKERLQHQLADQRDMYRFIHDRALHLGNQGAAMSDLANASFYPKGLQADWSTHGYYGTLSHNLRAAYEYYLGWYDSDPASLHPLSRKETAQRYVAAMGGAAAVMKQAQAAFGKSDYRWTVQLLDHLVYAQPDNAAARALQADALEQLGYQAESAIWRNEYLTAAQELRSGVKPVRLSTQGPDLTRAMSTEMIFDLLAVRINHEKADGLQLGVNLRFSDLNEDYALELSNSVLNNTKGRVLAKADVSLTLTQAALFKMLVAKVPLAQLVQAGEVKVEGNPQVLGKLFACFEEFDPLFNIVTPIQTHN